MTRNTYVYSNPGGWVFMMHRTRWFPVTISLSWVYDQYILGIYVFRNGRQLIGGEI